MTATEKRSLMFSTLAMRSRPIIIAGQPGFARPDSQLVSASQFYEPECAQWMSRLGFQGLDRKGWEYSYILQAIMTYARTGEGTRGLSFGCGKETAVSILASTGSKIIATDYVDPQQVWSAATVDDLFFGDHIDRPTFDERVEFRHVDMNNIDSDLRDFDFCWSTGSLEHIGGHENGLRFVEAAMNCLKPGGIAVHTTEFTITSETVGQDYPTLSFYCRRDIEALAQRLLEAGHMIILNFDRGTTVADTHVDVPPYHAGRTLCAHCGPHVITSIGLIVQKSPELQD